MRCTAHLLLEIGYCGLIHRIEEFDAGGDDQNNNGDNGLTVCGWGIQDLCSENPPRY